MGSFPPAIAPVNEASLVGTLGGWVAHAHIVVVLVVPVRLVRVHFLEQRESHSPHTDQNEEKDDLLHGPRHPTMCGFTDSMLSRPASSGNAEAYARRMKLPLPKRPYPMRLPNSSEPALRPVARARRPALLAAGIGAATCLGGLVSGQLATAEAIMLGAVLGFLSFVGLLAAPAVSLDNRENEQPPTE